MAEIPASALERTKRLDAEYFQPKHLRIAQLLEARHGLPMSKVVTISDGNHFSISDEFSEQGIPYYRGQDVVGHFFIEQAAPVFIPEKAYRVPHMTRSHLKKGDVLLSIVGTIGEASLVFSENPATCSCKLAILRPQAVAPEYLAVFLRTKHGRSQVERLTRGAVQMGLLLEDMDQIKVARFSIGFEDKISRIVLDSRHSLEKAEDHTQQAEQTLLRALGLENWQPPEPLTYTRRASDAFTAERLDAEHFQPKYDNILDTMRAHGLSLVDLGTLIYPVKNGFDFRDFTDEGTPYIRVGDVGQCRIKLESSERIPLSPSEVGKAISLIEGDVLYTRKGSFGNAAHVRLGQTDVIISSEIMLVRLKDERKADILPEYLAMYFNALPGRYLAEKYAHGAAFYSVSQDDLSLYPVPILPIKQQEEIKLHLDKGEDARRQAHALLEAAKRAVEIAIEQNEAEALAFLAAGT